MTIGDDCTLNAGSVVQCHSQEDGAFKSDRIAIGSGCTLGVGAFVHYGVTIGDGASSARDSFLMKGEDAARGVETPHGEVELENPPPTEDASQRRPPAGTVRSETTTHLRADGATGR